MSALVLRIMESEEVNVYRKWGMQYVNEYKVGTKYSCKLIKT